MAYIGPDGRSVHLRIFCRGADTDTEEWDLGEETSLPINLSPEAPHLVHLSWNNSGTFLAVFDACGRIALYANAGAFGRMQLLRNCEQDDEDDSGRIVAAYWFPIIVMKGMTMYVRSATRNAEAWSYQTDYDRMPGPCHPVETRSALICLTMSGKVRLLYDAGPNFAERTLDLGIAKSCDDLLTHASFAPDKDGKLLLVTYNISRQLQLFGMRINWNEKKQNLRGQQVTTGVDPVIEASTLHTVPSFTPLQSSIDQSDLTSMTEWDDMPIAQLTHLQLFPASFDKNWEERICPLLVAVFSHIRNAAHPSHTHREDFSVISHWELHTLRSTLHPTFNELNSKANPAKPESSVTRIAFRQRPNVISTCHILAMNPLQSNSLLAVSSSDGLIVVRDRVTMDALLPQVGAEQVSNLTQAGFSFPTSNEHLGLCFAFSTNGCIAVAMDSEGKVKLRRMEVMTDWSDDSQPEQPIIALTSLYSIACFHSWSNDDVLATVPRNTKQEHIDMFLRNVYTPLNLSVDYATNESQKDTVNLFRFTTFARCLSAQNVLANFRQPRSGSALSKKIAWAILNIRGIAVTLGITIKNERNPSPVDPNVINLISGITKWQLDIVSFIMDELLTLSDALRGSEINKATIYREIQKMNTPALHLVFQSIPRMLLRFNNQYLLLTFGNAHKTGAQIQDSADRRAIGEHLELMNEAPVKLHHFKRMIDEAETMIKRTYDSFGDEARTEAEKTMLVSGALPDALIPAVQHFLTHTIEAFRAETDPAKIFFHDVRWLGLTDDQASKTFLKEQKFDVYTKKAIEPKARLKRCTRCRSLMDDTPNRTKVPLPTSLTLLDKLCICASNWMAGPET